MNESNPKLLTTDALVSFLKKASQAYRSGSPIIDDDTYVLYRIREGSLSSSSTEFAINGLYSLKKFKNKSMGIFSTKFVGIDHIAETMGII
jgi:hypothetical protein